MLSLGIIWNKAYEFNEEIVKDVSERVIFYECFDLDLDIYYDEFVMNIYKSENMENWKIEKKLNEMSSCDNKKISIIFFEFDDSKIVYHEFKHKEVYDDLENLKRYIREKYSKLIDNYVFDIVFHSTDNYDELRKCIDIIERYENSIIYPNDLTSKYKKLLLKRGIINE